MAIKIDFGQEGAINSSAEMRLNISFFPRLVNGITSACLATGLAACTVPEYPVPVVQKISGPENPMVITPAVEINKDDYQIFSLAVLALNPSNITYLANGVELISIGNEVALAIPVTFGVAVGAYSSGIMQDTIEGRDPTLRFQNIQRLVVDKNGNIITDTGKVIGRTNININSDVAGDSQFADPNSMGNSNTESNFRPPEVTPRPEVEETLPEEYKIFAKRNPTVAKLLKELGLDNSYFIRCLSSSKELDMTKVTPFISLEGSENQIEVIARLIQAAKIDNLNLQLVVGTSATPQALEVASKFNESLVIGIDIGFTPGGGVLVNNQLNPNPTSLATSFRADVNDLARNPNLVGQFKSVYVVAPSPEMSSMKGIFRSSYILTQDGGRVVVLLDPACSFFQPELQGYVNTFQNDQIWDILNPREVNQIYGLTSMYWRPLTSVGIPVLTFLK